jgi:hypothetical protein
MTPFLRDASQAAMARSRSVNSAFFVANTPR